MKRVGERKIGKRTGMRRGIWTSNPRVHQYAASVSTESSGRSSSIAYVCVSWRKCIYNGRCLVIDPLSPEKRRRIAAGPPCNIFRLRSLAIGHPRNLHNAHKSIAPTIHYSLRLLCRLGLEHFLQNIHNLLLDTPIIAWGRMKKRKIPDCAQSKVV